jgi:hypothetical protein
MLYMLCQHSSLCLCMIFRATVAPIICFATSIMQLHSLNYTAGMVATSRLPIRSPESVSSHPILRGGSRKTSGNPHVGYLRAMPQHPVAT